MLTLLLWCVVSPSPVSPSPTTTRRAQVPGRTVSGALKFLAEQFDLTRVPMVGASAGSMAAVLAACGVSADTTLQTAYEMSLKHNIWERPLGLLGIWGSLIEKVSAGASWISTTDERCTNHTQLCQVLRNF